MNIATFKLIVVLFVSFPAGCAKFQSVQTDLSYEKGTPSRQITTRTSSTTFFASKSDLTRYRAATSDKIQSLGIGSLNVESPTNNLTIIDAVVGAAVKAAAGK